MRRAGADEAARIDLAAVRARCSERVEVSQAYEGFASIGLDYGPAFRGLQSLWRGTNEALAEVSLPEGIEGAERYGIHPALLDAAFQSLLGAVGSDAGAVSALCDGQGDASTPRARRRRRFMCGCARRRSAKVLRRT